MPEMCLIGYKFKDKQEVMPFCEPITEDFAAIDPQTMPTIQFCKEVSAKYEAWVVCGLGEI